MNLAVESVPAQARLAGVRISHREDLRSDRAAGFFASVAAHLLILLAAGHALVSPASFGVQAGSGGLEVDLVAAPAPLETAPALAPEPLPAVTDAVNEPQEVVQTAPELPAAPAFQDPPARPAERTEPLLRASSGVQGDGSSAIAGRDATTMRSGGGAVSASADYLRNPAPAYPEKARRLKQEGRVLLKVVVDRAGRAKALEISQSSGYELLDEAASRAVRRWRFSPSKIGSLPVESEVEVPIHFQLKDNSKRIG